MSELEIQTIVIEHLALAHSFGEAIWDRVDMWIGLSTGLIVLSYLAPERLTRGVATLILTLYILITLILTVAVLGDLSTAEGVIDDAGEIAEKHGLHSNALQARLEDIGNFESGGVVFLTFALGLFIGTIGYVVYVVRQVAKQGEVDT